ncbi:AraC family transcriptional regulator [Pseudomonas brassicacearum]
MKAHRIAGHHLGHLFFRIVDEQTLDGQNTLEHAVVVDHKQLVSMPRQFLEATQVAQYHFKADVLSDRHHLEVHQRTDLLLVVGQRRAHTLTLLAVEGFHQFVDNVPRQFRRKVCEFVGVHFLGRRQQLVIIHVGDQGFPNRVRHFEQDVTVAISLDQLPDRQTLFQWQGFKNVGDVGGVQIIELALQLNEILPVDQVLDPVMMRTFLAMRQVFDDPLALQQLNNLSEAILKAFLRFFYIYLGHRRTPLPAVEHAGRINQSIHDWQN